MKLLYTSAAALMLVGAVTANAADNRSISATLGDGTKVIVTAVNENIIKVTNLAPGETEHTSRAAVLTEAPASVKTADYDRLAVLTTNNEVTAILNKVNGEVTITSGADRSISDNGVRTLVDGKRSLSLYTMGNGAFYGGGERGYSFDVSGDTLVMYNKQNYGYTAGEKRIKQMNITVPLFVSSAGYAVLFDDYAAAEMIMSNPVKYISESPDPISYYYINGTGTLSGVEYQYSLLTGRQDLPPFWSLGYITSKYGYKTEAETRGVIDTLKLNKYPVDGIVLDLYWYGKEEDMGRLAWDPEQWPTHKQMLSDLKDQGVNLIAISQPYVLRNGRAIDNYNMMAPKGMFVADSTGMAPQEVKIWVGEGGMFDVSNPLTRQWLGNRYKELTLDGVGGWWGDLGEPEVHPETGRHANGLTARQYHNQYGNDWSEIIYDLFKKEFPDTRLMTMMRGGTAGLQRYSVYPWSTDVSRSWGGLQPQITIMLNSGLSGLGYMSHDVGGFAIDPENPVDPELYVRWLQLGTFSPILRTHAQQVAEPYRYPEQQDIILPLIRERYRWLPYNYTLAYENASGGQPLVRPLNYYDPSTSPLSNVSDQYLWGANVMVAPVLEQGATERKVVFPDGLWVDYSDPTKVYKGGEEIVYPAPLDVLPLFVSAGAFIPTADYAMENTGDYDASRYTINYYPVEGTESEYTMYEDDRMSTRSLEEKKYTLFFFEGDDNAEEIRISVWAEGSYPGMAEVKNLTFKINNVAKAPARVMLDGKKLSKKAWRYDAKKKMVVAEVDWNIHSAMRLNVIK